MNELIERLKRPQEIEVAMRPSPSPESLRSALERGFVYIRFPGTRGGTELGVNVDQTASRWKNADFSHHVGQVEICGALTLDYTQVRFQGTIDLSSMKGTGSLERAEVNKTSPEKQS